MLGIENKQLSLIIIVLLIDPSLVESPICLLLDNLLPIL